MQKLTLTQQVGNVISTLLLGQTKEMIIRTDEGLKHLAKTVDLIKHQLDDNVVPDLRDTRERVIKVETKVS